MIMNIRRGGKIKDVILKSHKYFRLGNKILNFEKSSSRHPVPYNISNPIIFGNTFSTLIPSWR